MAENRLSNLLKALNLLQDETDLYAKIFKEVIDELKNLDCSMKVADGVYYICYEDEQNNYTFELQNFKVERKKHSKGKKEFLEKENSSKEKQSVPDTKEKDNKPKDYNLKNGAKIPIRKPKKQIDEKSFSEEKDILSQITCAKYEINNTKVIVIPFDIPEDANEDETYVLNHIVITKFAENYNQYFSATGKATTNSIEFSIGEKQFRTNLLLKNGEITYNLRNIETNDIFKPQKIYTGKDIYKNVFEENGQHIKMMACPIEEGYSVALFDVIDEEENELVERNVLINLKKYLPIIFASDYSYTVKSFEEKGIIKYKVNFE